MTPSPEFFLGSFIAVAWAFSVYLAYHLGRNLESRANEGSLRNKVRSLYDSPWLFRG